MLQLLFFSFLFYFFFPLSWKKKNLTLDELKKKTKQKINVTFEQNIDDCLHLSYDKLLKVLYLINR